MHTTQSSPTLAQALAVCRAVQDLAAYYGVPEQELASDLLDFLRTYWEENSSQARAWRRLTPRQREVAALVAAGCDNRQICERLFLASNTVEHYVSAALHAFGLRSRKDLHRVLNEWTSWQTPPLSSPSQPDEPG